MIILQHLIIELWDKFIEPLKAGMYSINEVVKVFKHNIDLFTNDKIISNSSVPDYKTLHDDEGERKGEFTRGISATDEEAIGLETCMIYPTIPNSFS